jgi:hypothetical protein
VAGGLGSVTVIREEVRAGGWENAIDTLLSDLRYAARRFAAIRASRPSAS